MTEFWEKAFNNKQEMWGMNPAQSAELTKNFFVEKKIKNILIPGIGYGRNAQPFIANEIVVTGIEISKTAIELAKKHYGTALNIFHGSVTKMPFDDKKYDGIFCYALIHLFDNEERKKLINDCYHQLNENGYMIFTAINKYAPQFGQGKLISKDRYEIYKGAKIFYYDRESVKFEFEKYGLFEITEEDENQPMYLIKCKKVKILPTT
ncbi:class I SAM-dependent methyltransferase [Ulvibacter litoralis]|uniref:Methyltransferase domain-containing protein n=1 Tax=Ulvibacter litoralis TaxID=227084 RepID=A0A1G7IBC1_9FLAO|nr:class I SAM-dependent methyltransferase [Ulvibacter litoralis]GHC61868.1 methyltransferase [Ulvibacter litoralis]SDF10057.1 Methyltransferase domain-containing protein [Ulvibacter litoralis]